MVVGVVTLEMLIAEAHSLKEKRSVLQSLIKRARNKFNASIAEVEDQDMWQRATLGISVIGNSRAHVDQQLQTIVRFLESEPRIEVATVDMEML